MSTPRLPAQVYWRRRAMVLTALVAVASFAVMATPSLLGDDGGRVATHEAAPAGSSSTTTTVPTTTTTTPVPATERELVLVDTITGDITPKSVVSNQHGLFMAQNMMYRHTVTIYDRDLQLVKTIPDTIEATEFGLDFAEGTALQGAPVEAAFTPDGSHAYVSNYLMYGPGFGGEPSDSCNDDGHDDSYLYRIDMEALEIDQVIRVGAVPKFLAVSPDGDHVVVSNWCSFDVSIVDTERGEEIRRVDVGRHPRGVVFDSERDLAYVTVMDGEKVAVLDMTTLELDSFFPMSGDPRHILIGPEGDHLYITRNRADDVVKVDIETKQIVESVATGAAPRSMTISPDGLALYVVNYEADTVSKVLTADLTEIQELPTGHHPIGITYDHATHRVWVANYVGSIMVFDDAPAAD